MAATIPRAAVDFLTEEINGISADAQARVLKVLQGINWTPENVAECRELVLQALAAVMPTYTDMAAQASADFYDAAREMVVGERLGAQAISGYDQQRTERAVRAFVQLIVDGRTVDEFNRSVLGRISYDVQRAAGNCVFENGSRDSRKPRYARVPTGPDTCAFCIMLASRGFVYHSAATAGALDHYHDHDDCRIVPGWDVYGAGPSRAGSWSTSIEGYDPDALYDQYLDLMSSGRISPSVGLPSSRNLTSLSGETFRTKETAMRYVRDAESVEDLQARVASVYSAIDRRYPERDPSKAGSETARRNIYRSNQRRRQYLSELYTEAKGIHSKVTFS